MAVLALGCAAEARADVAPDFCEAEALERYLGERCLKCEASEYEPERCRQAFAAAGLRQRCSGSPQGATIGTSIWGELWCLPQGSTAALPAPLPPIERVSDRPGDPLPGLPKIPPDFPDPPLLVPAADSSSPAEDLNPPPPATPSAPPPPTTRPATASAPAASGCKGCSAGEPAWTLLALAPALLALRRPRRRR